MLITKRPITKAMHTLVATGLGVSLAPSVFADDTGLTLEEIVVTAEARSESLQEVPVSVTAFTATDIQAAGVENTQDFINLTPNVTLDDSFTVGNTFVTIRGVAQINNADSPVAIVIDGVPQGNQKQFKQELFDIERIEVLRGPQGALYGRNAIGGAINIVSKQPGDEVEGFISGGIGNGDSSKVNAGISLPLVEDELFLRLSGSYKDRDGLIDNKTLNEEVDYLTSTDLRAKLLWNASDNLTLDLRYAYSDLDGGAISDTSLAGTTGTGDPAENSNKVDEPTSDILGESQRRIDDFSLKVDWSDAAGTLSYIFGYTDMEEDYYGDLDFTATSLADQSQILDVEMTSHELRFISPDEDHLRWIAGAFHQETNRTLSTLAHSFPILTSILTGGALSDTIVLLDAVDDNENTAWAVFGQLEYDISDATELSLSLRYDRDERDQVSSGLSEAFDAWQPKLTITHQMDEGKMIYATASTGFRSGGFNADGSLFQDEFLTNYELGFKNELFNNRMILNGAIYHSQSEDFQFFFVDLDRGGAQVIDNIDEVAILGAELEFQALLSESFRLFGGIGITDSDIKEFDQFPDQEGNHTPKTTKYTANLGFQYEFPLAEGIDGVIRTDIEQRGRKYWHPDNLESQDPFALVNVRLTAQADDWSVTLWGRNLTDEEYYADFNDVSYSGLFGSDIGFHAQPMTLGIEGRYDF